MSKTKGIPNALIDETSPYLLQHAYNPVQWLPYSEKAFELALSQNKPVLISIGYSACHWCHVMEHECFEDVEVAELMNKNFVNIKVDREERSDVDMIYMQAVQLNVALLKNLTDEQIIQRYDKISDIIDVKIKKALAENKQDVVERLRKSKSTIDDILIKLVLSSNKIQVMLSLLKKYFNS